MEGVVWDEQLWQTCKDSFEQSVLADETTVMLFLAVLGNIIFLEVPDWFLEDDFLWKCFWKCFFLFGQTNTLFFIFALHLEMKFFTSFREGFFLSSMRSLKNSFYSQILSRHNIAIWKIFPKEMWAMLRLMAVSFLWRSSCNSEGREAMKTCLREGSLNPFSL